MNTSTITIKTDRKTKTRALKIATELGIDLNGILNGYIKQFIRTKTVYFSLENENPSDYLLNAIDKSEKEHENGETIAFDNPSDAIEFLNKHSKKK